MPANAFLPRETVHAWSESIGDHATDHTSSLQRLLRDQRRLTRFIEENQAELAGATGGVCIYLTGVIARMFELAGGRLRKATWAQIREAEARVGASIGELLPLDDGFLDRLHALGDRAQPHIVDEAAMVLWDDDRGEEEEELDPVQSLKVLAICWVVTDVLDANWSPPKSAELLDSYTYVHVEPTKKDED